MEKLYLNLPSFLQNFAITLYGIKTYRQRFGGDISFYKKNINSVYSSIDKQILALQKKRFSELLHHASKTVPFYKKIVLDNGFGWEEVTPDNYKKIFPVVSKEDILNNPKDFITEDPNFLKKAIKLNTSGSSGTPLKILADLDSRRINYFFFDLLLKEMGASYKEKSTTFAGRVLSREGDSDPARYDFYNKTQYLSSYSLSSENVNCYISALNKWKPEYIDSYPSIIFQMIKLAKEKNLKINFIPKFILTSSETLYKNQKLEIEEFFSCPVVDHYGCTEMSVSAFSKDNKYYIHPIYSVLELDAIDDQKYKIYATGLLNFAMPLIRYDIGDVIVSDNSKNPYIFSSIEGRVDDLIVTPEGRRIGRIDPAFKGIEGVRLSQLVQTSRNQIEVKIVLQKEMKEKFNENMLIENLKQRTSEKINYRITYHDDIESSSNGKFKSVISSIDQTAE